MIYFVICRIAELDVADENDINWDLLAEGWSSVRSPQWLRSKWWTIKRQIANHKDVSFPGNVLLAYSITPKKLVVRSSLPQVKAVRADFHLNCPVSCGSCLFCPTEESM